MGRQRQDVWWHEYGSGSGPIRTGFLTPLRSLRFRDVDMKASGTIQWYLFRVLPDSTGRHTILLS